MQRLLGCLVLAAALTARAESLNDLTWLTEDFPPYNYAVDDQAFGLMVDVLLEASRAVDDPVERANIQVLPWTRAVHMAGQDVNSVLFSLARTAEREADYQWVGPVVPIRIVLIGLPAAAEKPPEQWRIGVVRDDVAVRLVQAAGYRADQLDYSAYPGSVARMLLAGRVDVWAYGELPAQRRLDALPGSDDWRIHQVLSSTQAYFGFHPQADPALVGRFQLGLDHLLRADEDGIAPLQRLIERYSSLGLD